MSAARTCGACALRAREWRPILGNQSNVFCLTSFHDFEDPTFQRSRRRDVVSVRVAPSTRGGSHAGGRARERDAMDFRGQALAEWMMTLIIVLFSLGGFLYGYHVESYSAMMTTYVTGVALAFVTTCPDWWYFNLNPVKLLPIDSDHPHWDTKYLYLHPPGCKCEAGKAAGGCGEDARDGEPDDAETKGEWWKLGGWGRKKKMN